MDNNQTIIPIFFACNKVFMKHVAVSILSVHLNHHLPGKLEFYILTRDINSNDTHKMLKFFLKLGIKIDLIDTNDFLNSSCLPIFDNRYSLDVYSRLFIPLIFNGIYDKAIYLDGDTVTLEDIEMLYNIDTDNSCFCAIKDASARKHADRLGLPSDRAYFNAGVLLINIPRWNKLDLTEKTLQYISNNKSQVLLQDQDALNIVAGSDWTLICSSWNFQTHSLYLHPSDFIKYFGREFQISDIFIIHYTRASKPWHKKHEPDLDNIYIKYRKLTPWKDFYQESDPKNTFKRIIRNTLRSVGLLWRLPMNWRVYLNK